MANKTRTDIIAQLKAYIPNLDVTSHDTSVDNLIDLAAEHISGMHNFSYLRATTPATHDVTADEYSIAESDFSFTNIKEVLFLEWIKSSTGENARIHYLPERDFHDRYRYISYSGNTDGKPRHYTRVGNTFLFNCQLDETVTVRAWYQQYHGTFADDDASHSFVPDMLGFHAIVCVCLQECHRLLPGLQLSPKAQAAAGNAMYWIEKLIDADLNRADEPVEFVPQYKKDTQGGITDPYYWV
jgi:hypothetical protein